MMGLPADVVLELDAAAQQNGIARELVRAIAWVESRGQQSAQSARGAIGVMQLLPTTALSLGVDPHVRAQNIEGGARLLRHLLDKFGEQRKAIAAYVWGPARVEDRPSEAEWPEDVRRYVLNVVDRIGYEQGAIASATTVDLPTSGPRSFGFPRETHRHNGVDLKARGGDPVYAAAAGEVEHAHNDSDHEGFDGYGRVVVVRDDQGNRQLYAHLERVRDDVQEGAKIGMGQHLGYVGRSGNATGDVLHFEVSPRAYPQSNQVPRLDPIAWLAGRLHPIARVIVGGKGAPSPFGPTPATPLRRSWSRSELSERASRLRGTWARYAGSLASLEHPEERAPVRKELEQAINDAAEVLERAGVGTSDNELATMLRGEGSADA